MEEVDEADLPTEDEERLVIEEDGLKLIEIKLEETQAAIDKFLELYDENIYVQVESVIGQKSGDRHYLEVLESGLGILAEFVLDEEIQEITVVSATLGFVSTYTKQSKRQRLDNEGEQEQESEVVDGNE